MPDQVPTPVLNLIKSAFPSSLGRVPNLLEALMGSLVIRHTANVLDPNRFAYRFSLEVKRLASSIKNASKEAEASSNSFPVELPFLDAEGLEKQVLCVSFKPRPSSVFALCRNRISARKL